MIDKDYKLPTYYITGMALRNGNFVDMHGTPVHIDLDKQNLDVLDVIPIFAEHGGPQVGYVTRIYKMESGEVRFDGFVFDKKLYDYLESVPGISAELTMSTDKILITGLVLTERPAIYDAEVTAMVELSAREQAIIEYIRKNLGNEIEIDDKVLKEVANIVTKYIAENEYPSPQVKCSMNDLETKITELQNKIEDLEAQLLQAKEALEEKETELSETKKLLSEKEAKLEEIEMSSKIAELTSKIKELDPEFTEEALMSKPKKEQIAFLSTYYEIKLSSGKQPTKDKIELTAPITDDTEEQEWKKAFGLQ